MKRAFTWIALAGILAAAIFLSLKLAGTRVYRAEECTEVYKAMNLGRAETRAGDETLFQRALSGAVGNASRTADAFVSGRLAMLMLFWVNWMLLASATGEALFSRRWLVALAGAATLAPLWEHGFEIRHDNLLLAGVLSAWMIARSAGTKPLAGLLVGVLTAALQFVSFKSLIFLLPLSAAMIFLVPAEARAWRGRVALAWIGGVVAGLLAFRFAAGLRPVPDFPPIGFPFIPAGEESWFGLGGLASQLLLHAPLFLALLASALIAFVTAASRGGRAVLNREGNFPEVLLLASAAIVALIDPAPAPYRLLLAIPYAFPLVFRYAMTLGTGPLLTQGAVAPLVAFLVIFAHLAPFGFGVRRHFNANNFRQEQLIKLAEDITVPRQHSVWDGVGMVPTRPGLRKDWLLNPKVHLKQGNGVRAMLAEVLPPVIIPNYRTDLLGRDDQAFFQEHYTALSDDFLVLGKILPAGGGTFQVVKAGRYRIAPLETSNLLGTYPDDWTGLSTPTNAPVLAGTIDDKPLTKQPIELAPGMHRLECQPEIQAAVIWVGPKLDRLPKIGKGDHRFLFMDWY